jgi:hypothetical protein
MANKLFSTEKNDKPLATDEECRTRRAVLIAIGAIKPAPKSELIEKGDGTIILSTRRDNRARRKQLIEQGIIDPTLCELITNTEPYIPKEEGEFVVRPIKSEKEYNMRKMAYFRIMQEMLYSRKDLKLRLDKKADDDPKWYF